jgi:hypothetical protein
MIELEDCDFSLATIRTPRLSQGLDDELMGSLAARISRRGDLRNVPLAALAEVLLEARATPPLVTILVAVEGLEREGLLAPLAPPESSI